MEILDIGWTEPVLYMTVFVRHPVKNEFIVTGL